MNAIQKYGTSDNLDNLQRMAKMLATSGYFDAKGSIEVQIAQTATKIMAGAEMGFGPFASVNGIHIISGKPSIGANLMASAVKSSGRYDYRVKEMSKEKCVLEFFERIGDKRESLGISEFTKEDATAAGTQNMAKFARNMMFARALSNGVRWYCPDIFSGNVVYVPEELGAEVDGDGNVVEANFTVTKATEATQSPVEATGQPTERNAQAEAVFSRPEQGVKPPATMPRYEIAYQNLTGNAYDLVKWTAALHKASDGPCTQPQYGFLVALTDALSSNQHGYILSLLCQSEISKDNLPGRKVAASLLELLPETIKDSDGNKIPNPKYRADIANMIREMSPVAEGVAA